MRAGEGQLPGMAIAGEGGWRKEVGKRKSRDQALVWDEREVGG